MKYIGRWAKHVITITNLHHNHIGHKAKPDICTENKFRSTNWGTNGSVHFIVA
jgi:hypothetical protein